MRHWFATGEPITPSPSTTAGHGGEVAAAPVFPVLDTLRLVGALAVLTTHTSFQTGTYLRYGSFGTFLARLDVGVAIFFVLSGFLLSRPWLAAKARGTRPPAVARYYRKRVVRIWPVYVVTVLLALTLMPENQGSSSSRWASSLSMLDPYTDKTLPHGLTHMWSLSAEVAFYAVLPVVMWLVLARDGGGRRLTGVLVLMGAISVAWNGVLAREVEPYVSGATGLWLFAHLLWFAGGIGLAWLHVAAAARPGSVAARVASAFGLPGVCWSLAGGLVLIACTPLAGPTLLVQGTEAQSVLKHWVYAGVGVLLVGSGVFAPADGRYARVLALPLLRHLGHISYSMFCIHLVLLALAFHLTGTEPFTGHGLLIWTTTLGLTLLASEALYRLVEMPAMRFLAAPPRWARREPGDAPTRATTSPPTSR